MSTASSALRVMLLSTDLARGGAETQVALLAGELHRRGHRISVVSLVTPSAYATELEAAGVGVHPLGMQPGRPSLRGLVHFLALLRRERPDVLHAHLFHANLLARLARLLCPVPVLLSTIHSLSESGRASTGTRLRDTLYCATDWLSDRTICVSHAAAERHLRVRAVSANRLLVIPNGAAPDRFSPEPCPRHRLRQSLGLGDGFVWLAAGRLMWKKDYPTLLAALALQPDAVLLIAGEGPLRAELQALAAPLGHRVRFLGLRDDLPEWMAACDGFVLSSVVEGLPMVLIEAAMAGLPCVATDAGGAREVVIDGETGFVAPPSNAEALAAAMARLSALPPDSRARMGMAAQADARSRFALASVASQWEALYRVCLAEARSHLLP